MHVTNRIQELVSSEPRKQIWLERHGLVERRDKLCLRPRGRGADASDRVRIDVIAPDLREGHLRGGTKSFGMKPVAASHPC